MRKRMIAVLAAVAVLAGGFMPAAGYCIGSGAIGAAINGGGTALGYMSMAVVPLMILQDILPGCFNDTDTPSNKDDTPASSPRGGLALTLPEASSIKRFCDKPVFLTRLFGKLVFMAGALAGRDHAVPVNMPACGWMGLALVMLLFARPSRARGDTDGYILSVRIFANAVRVFPVRVFCFISRKK